MELFVLISILLSLTATRALNLPSQVDRPPTIIRQPGEEVYAISKRTLELPCVAQAVPPVNVTHGSDGYVWMKDGERFEVVSQDQSDKAPGSAVMSPTDGSISFWKIEDISENGLEQFQGLYQCLASNRYGIALSREVRLKVAPTPPGQTGKLTVTVEEGQSLTLPCESENPDGSEITWKFSRNDVELSDRISQGLDGSLVFSNVIYATDDRLVVYCNVKNRASRKSADGIDYVLNVTRVVGPVPDVPPQIIVPSESVERRTVLLGEQLVMPCVATGKPTPSLMWEHLSGDGTRFKDSGHTAVIDEVKLEDNGRYRCSVINTPSIMKVVAVTVEARPYFESDHNRPTDVIKAPGEDVTIRCQPSGIPKPEVEWRVNGEPINDLPENPDREIQGNSIRISNLKQSDTAVYQCVARNKHGSLIQQGYLNVLTWPPVRRPGNVANQAQVEQKSLSFKCHIFASPAPVISWTKNGNDIVTSERFNVSENGHIQIHNLKRSDVGNYRCKGENELGDVTVDFDVKVFNRTVLHVKPEETVERGKPITLTAQIEKDSGISRKSQVIWSKSGVEIGRGDTFYKSIAEFSDAGNYKAQVHTSHDSATNYAKLTVIDRPSPPEEFKFIVVDTLQVQFDWIPGNDFGSSITEYEIEFEENTYEPGRWQLLKSSIAGNLTSINVVLSPGLNYSFRAFARNRVGWSVNSSSVTRRHKTPDAPPGIPKKLSARGTDPNVIGVSWEPVKGLEQNGPGFGYNLSYKERFPGLKNWTYVELLGETESYMIKGEQPYQEYRIRLTTFNDEGATTENPLFATSYTGEDYPELAPTDVIVATDDFSPKSALVTWKGVDEGSVRGKLLGYKVYYSDDDFESEYIAVARNETKINITNLQVQTTYKFAVAAYNSVGDGPRSQVIAQTTPRGVPEPGVIIVEAEGDEANITWNPPSQSAGLPSNSVRFEYREKFSSQWTTISSFTEYGEDITVTFDMESDTKYSFRVVTTNTYGSAFTKEITIASTSGPGLNTGNVTTQVWFIVIMCLIAFLIIVILIICCVRRNKGGKYPVAEKEHHHHQTQPFTDAEAGDYNDESDEVKKPLAEGSNNGKAAAGPARTRGDSVGGDSIEAFAGADPWEFNEDGSFIGQYGVITSPSDGNTPATPPDEKQNMVNKQDSAV